ncbi:hypothetical protein CG399_03655 [Bifidobacteriaceae bacterium NR015]|nr:hypothetical protein CG399_03655 [Bifidobacteriaceae bacterium NR015]
MSNEDPDEGKGFCWKVTSSCKKMFYEFTINGIIDKYYKETLSGMIGNERELRKELVQLRSKYNCWSGFISKFIPSLLIAVVFYIFSKFLPVVKDDQLLSFVVLVVLFIALFTSLSFKAANEEYEKMELIKDELEKIRYEEARCERMKALEAELNEMKLIKAELEKINNTIQPNPKKTSIRIYKRNSVRRSIFGR